MTTDADTEEIQSRKPRNAYSHQKLGEARKPSPLESLESVWISVKEYISVVLATRFVVICYISLKKLIHPDIYHFSCSSLICKFLNFTVIISLLPEELLAFLLC